MQDENLARDSSEAAALDQDAPPASLPRHLQSGVIVISGGKKIGGGSGIVAGSMVRRRASVGGRSNSSAGGSSNGGSGGGAEKKRSSGGGSVSGLNSAPRRKGRLLTVLPQHACLPGAFDDCLPGQATTPAGIDNDAEGEVLPMSAVEDFGERPSLMAASGLGPPKRGFFSSKGRVAPLPPVAPRVDSE